MLAGRSGGDAINWLQAEFSLYLFKIARLASYSKPRRLIGTLAVFMSDRVWIIKKARVIKL